MKTKSGAAAKKKTEANADRRRTARKKQASQPTALTTQTNLADHLLEGCQIIGYDWRYLYLNDAVVRQSQFERADLIDRTMMEVYPGIEETELFTAMRECMEKRTPRQMENRFTFPNGEVGYFELSIQPVPEGVFILSADITGRKQIERQLVQMQRLYATLSQVNQTIVRVDSREELYESICNVAVKFGKFSLAWVGLLDETTGTVEPVAAVGLDPKHWPLPKINLHHGALKDSLAAAAIRTSKVVTSEDASTDERTQSVREQMEKYNFHSAVAIPFLLKGKPIGVVGLVAGEIGLFKNADEVRLLEEIGLDISYALDSMEAEKDTSYLASIVRTSYDAIITKTLDGIITSWNESAERILGYTAEEIVGQPIQRIIPPERLDEETQILNWLREGRFVDPFETVRMGKDGKQIDVSVTVSPVRDASGRLIGSAKILRDISERKRADEDLRRQLNFLTALRDVDRVIASTFDVKMSLNALISWAVSLLSVDAATILMMDPMMNRLKYTAGTGFRFSQVHTQSIKLSDTLAGKAAIERRMMRISNLRNDPRNPFNTGFLEHEGIVSYYAVPLIVKGKVLGVLEVFDREEKARDQEWYDFLSTLAGQAAIAMDNASLYEDLQRSNNELSLAYDATIEGWSRALDLRDKETEGHTLRVTELALKIAQTLGLSEAELVHIRRGSLLHDIGKMGIPDSILLKPDKLTEEEWAVMRKHPVYAYELLRPVSYLDPSAAIPYCHHEKWDGSGYPRGLKGEEIPLAARIFAVVDVWDALLADRPYRAAWSRKQARQYIEEQAGKHFDPQIVKVFLKEIADKL